MKQRSDLNVEQLCPELEVIISTRLTKEDPFMTLMAAFMETRKDRMRSIEAVLKNGNLAYDVILSLAKFRMSVRGEKENEEDSKPLEQLYFCSLILLN